jgi:hypothetical protein
VQLIDIFAPDLRRAPIYIRRRSEHIEVIVKLVPEMTPIFLSFTGTESFSVSDALRHLAQRIEERVEHTAPEPEPEPVYYDDDLA